MSTPMTPDEKRFIDTSSYPELLHRWRFSWAGSDPIFQGDRGLYYADTMRRIREADPEAAIQASKRVGWGD